MNYYALQVKTRSEDLFITKVTKSLDQEVSNTIRFFFPKKKMPIRKEGKIKWEICPIFPGYIFLETEDLDTSISKHPIYWATRTTPGFYRFLPISQEPKPLEGRDLATLQHFLSFGALAEQSKVMFDENDRIKVIVGPLKGLEGRIIKVDKRKKRARIQLDMYEKSFHIDLAFEIIGQE